MYAARCFRDKRHEIIRAETRAALVIALKDVSPGGVSWIKDGSTILEGDYKWSILAEARDLRLGHLPVITNSLLRIDGVTGRARSPFERPRSDIDFFVLELGQHINVESLSTRIGDILKDQGAYLEQKRQEGAKIVLFVESTKAPSFVLELKPSFLRILADAEISLACFREL